MSTLKRLSCAAVAAAGLFAASPEQVEAGGFRLSIGVNRPYYGGHGYAGHGWYHGDYGHRSFHRHRVWHDTSHWDYYPGRLVPHGDHYDYIPGRRVWHNDGHWDHYGHSHRHWH